LVCVVAVSDSGSSRSGVALYLTMMPYVTLTLPYQTLPRFFTLPTSPYLKLTCLTCLALPCPVAHPALPCLTLTTLTILHCLTWRAGATETWRARATNSLEWRGRNALKPLMCVFPHANRETSAEHAVVPCECATRAVKFKLTAARDPIVTRLRAAGSGTRTIELTTTAQTNRSRRNNMDPLSSMTIQAVAPAPSSPQDVPKPCLLTVPCSGRSALPFDLAG
jgi:hypothetical protein